MAVAEEEWGREVSEWERRMEWSGEGEEPPLMHPTPSFMASAGEDQRPCHAALCDILGVHNISFGGGWARGTEEPARCRQHTVSGRQLSK